MLFHHCIGKIWDRRTGFIELLGNSNYTKSICIYGMCLPMHLHELFIAVNGTCVSQSENWTNCYLLFQTHMVLNELYLQLSFVCSYRSNPLLNPPRLSWRPPYVLSGGMNFSQEVCMFFEQYFVLIQLYRHQSLLCRKEQHWCCYCTLGPNHSGRTFSFAFLENLRSSMTTHIVFSWKQEVQLFVSY